jgi:hypothetical protein
MSHEMASSDAMSAPAHVCGANHIIIIYNDTLQRVYRINKYSFFMP